MASEATLKDIVYEVTFHLTQWSLSFLRTKQIEHRGLHVSSQYTEWVRRVITCLSRVQPGPILGPELPGVEKWRQGGGRLPLYCHTRTHYLLFPFQCLATTTKTVCDCSC